MLKTITMQGFKSFCHRTELVFGKGITAIVGPNGCGKSNLADALRWVLGEHNARVLRCNRLDELIFAGTKRRKAMGMTEVRLLLEDVFDEGEREIARRFSRDGAGEYMIDSKVCRWKDIYESLLGTGLSHTGYVVIGQGMIQELAGGKPEDRRAWIEEASGISRFRLSEKEVDTRLDGANRHIVRLADLLQELEERKGLLYSDWETAAEYHRLSVKKKDLELAMWLHQEQEESRRVRSMIRRIDKCLDEQKDCAASLGVLKDRMEPTKQELEHLTNELRLKTADREAIASELLSFEKNKDAARGKLGLVTREMEARSARHKVLKGESQALSQRAAELKDQLGLLGGLLDEVSMELARTEGERQEYEAHERAMREKVIGIRESMVSVTARISHLQVNKEQSRHLLNTNKRDAAQITQRLKALQKHVFSLQRELGETNDLIHLQEKEKKEKEKSRRLLEERKVETKRTIDEKGRTQKQLETQFASLKTRQRLLVEMEKSFEGYGKGPRTVLAAGREGLIEGIIGPVGGLFSCEAGYVAALAAAVGGAAQNVVVTDEKAVQEGIDYLKGHKAGRCTFLPLNLLRPARLHPRAVKALTHMTGVRPLISIVDYPDSLSACAEYLFGRVVLAQTLEEALAFMKDSSWANRTVTVEGENIQPGGAITGGEAPGKESVFWRKQELSLLGPKIHEVEGGLNSARLKMGSLNREWAELLVVLERSRNEILQAHNSISRLKEKVSQLGNDLARAKEEMDSCEVKIGLLATEEKALLVRIGEISSEEQEVLKALAQKEQDLRDNEAQIKTWLSADEQHADDIGRLAREKQKLEHQLNSLRRQSENLKGEAVSTRKSLMEEAKELSRLSALREQLILEGSGFEESISLREQRMSRLGQEITKLRKRSDFLVGFLEESHAKTESLLLRQSSLESRIVDGRIEVEELEKALSDTRQLIGSRYGIEDASECDHPRIHPQRALSQIEAVEASMKALGTVNLKAEEDYKELKERIKGIHLEKSDVEMAIDELRRTQRLIRKEIKQRFIETFEQVDDNFQRIFRELFGGGQGKLCLIHDTMGIEVLAEPPGSRNKHFNLLSGGERSLCGIALIFSILSVKPSPVMVLDEVDSSLDESNILRFAQFLKRYSENTQFVVITHQESTMEVADIIYGITMEEPGVSKVLSMRLKNG